MSRRSSAARSEEAKAYRQLYNTARWQRRREEQLDRQPFCAYCLERGKHRAATVADHVHPHKGDPVLFFEGELQSLCKACHDGEKQSEERNGFRNAFNDLGEPIDPKHPWYSP